MKDNPRILVVGGIGMDIELTLDEMLNEGEMIFSNRYRNLSYGKGATQAIAASRLGGQVTFVGRIGNDISGRGLKAKLQEEEVCIDYLYVDDELETGLKVTILEEGHEEKTIRHPGANENLSMADVERAFDGDYEAVMLQLEIPDDVIIGTFELAKERGIPVILDMSPIRPLPLGKIAGIDIISPDESGAATLTGIEVNSFQTANQVAKVLQAMYGPKHVVMKMGGRGALAFDSCSFKQISNSESDTRDMVSFDDIFMAALTMEYLRSGDIEEATEYANVGGDIKKFTL